MASVRLYQKVIKILRISCDHYTDIDGIWLLFTIRFQKDRLTFPFGGAMMYCEVVHVW